jgi:hypothetical protein
MIVAGPAAGLAAGDGLATAVAGVVSPQADTITAVKTVAAATRSFDGMWMLLIISGDTSRYRTGLRNGYSGVTYAALRPPSTRNVDPFT